MKCARCNTEMEFGIAIQFEEESFGIFRTAPVNSETLEIVYVLKCPKCGHSEDIPEDF